MLMQFAVMDSVAFGFMSKMLMVRVTILSVLMIKLYEKRFFLSNMCTMQVLLYSPPTVGYSQKWSI